MHEDDNGKYVLYDDVINLFNPSNVAQPKGDSPQQVTSVVRRTAIKGEVI